MANTIKEAAFDAKMKSILPLLEPYSNSHLVIGIPFYNETEALPQVLKAIDEALHTWIGKQQLIVCAGDASSEAVLREIEGLALSHPHLQFLMPPEANGRGMCIRAFLEIADALEADLLVFSANMGTEAGPGFDIGWLDSMLSPIQGMYDVVLASLKRYAGIDSMAFHFAAPILESFYGFRVSDPLGGVYAISHDFIEELAGEAKFWTDTIGGYGFDFWLVTRALVWNKALCEVNLGGIKRPRNLERRNRIFQETAASVFECIRRDSAVWLRDRLIIRVADIVTRSETGRPDRIRYPLDELLENLARVAADYEEIAARSLPAHVVREMNEALARPAEQFDLSDRLWITCVHNLLLAYTFGPEEQRQGELDVLTGIYNGRIAAYANQLNDHRRLIAGCPTAEQDTMLLGKIELMRRSLTEEAWRQKPRLNRQWLDHVETSKPPLVPMGYMEYVPGEPVVAPKKIMGLDKRVVNVDAVFRNLRRLYEDKFDQFVHEGLQVNRQASPAQHVAAVEDFMAQTEELLGQILPGDLHTAAGLRQFLEGLYNLLPPQPMYVVSADILREAVMHFPPINLMVPLGYYKPADLLENMDVREAMSYLNLVESWSFVNRGTDWIVEQARPDKFEWVDLEPLVISDELPFATASHSRLSNLNRITARITTRPLMLQKGGRFPRLLYLTSIVRRMAIAEQFSRLTQQNVKERKDIGAKLRNTLMGLKQGDDFSAAVIYENGHHRLLVQYIRKMAQRLEESGSSQAGAALRLLADGYGSSQVLEDGTFLTCTAWSWASYSNKGGRRHPPALSTSIESRWFNHDFLEHLYQELGYDPAEVMKTVNRMMLAGKSAHNLLDRLLPARPKDVMVVIQEPTDEPSRTLQRYAGNPLLEPIPANQWESKYVLNPGALRIDDRVYLFYRAVGEDDISYIGLAVTDGYRVLERLPQPIFSPVIPEERMGCEDPRLIIIDERIWMLYTAYDSNLAQIAAASITVDDFLARRFEGWQREGLAFKNIWDKDAILFPERIQGKYVLYHRIEPSMWITYMNEVEFPCREQHAIIIGPRPGRMWDSLKIGAGAQPLKTIYGWLLIYHGVDRNYVYRLGVILVDLEDPQRVLYRSPNPVLEPEEDYEVGLSGAWVPNVVFTCGAVGGSDKEILEDDDEVLVYYGAADTSIGVARATVADLIPEKYRCKSLALV